MICAQIGKELSDTRQKEGRIEFIRGGDALRICLQCRRPRFESWVGKICGRRDRLPTPVFLGFPCGSSGKESACIVGDLGLIPGLERSPGEGKGYPLQYPGPENSMDYTLWVTNSWTRLSHFHFSWRFLKKKKGIKLQCDLAMPLLGIYPEKTTIQRDTCTPRFIAALLTTARTWKQPRSPSTDEWMETMWCIYTEEY